MEGDRDAAERALTSSSDGHRVAIAATPRPASRRCRPRRSSPSSWPTAAPARAGAASRLVGLGLVRYVLRAEPLASASPAEVVGLYGRTLQRDLTGRLDA